MRFTFRISKIANKFFFISNLSEWHFSCRKSVNQKWIKDTGPLSRMEKSALTEFRKIMRRYGFTYKDGVPRYVGRYFYLYQQNRSWNEFKKSVSRTEYKKVKEIFSVFNQRFEKVWKATKKEEKERRTALLASALLLEKNKKLIRFLESLFPETAIPKNIRIVALFLPLGKEGSAAGGANIGNETLTLEIPALQPNTFELDISMGILFHEVAHILFSRIHAKEMIKKIIRELKLTRKPVKKSPVTTIELINEIATNALVPCGYLTRKFYGKKFTATVFSPGNLRRMKDAHREFRTKKKITNHYRLIKYFAWRLQSTVARHVHYGGKIDETFLKKVALILKD